MRRTMDKSEYGSVWQKRNRLTDLNFADNIAIVAEEENVYQEMTTKLEEQSAQVGLNISREKTKAMGITLVELLRQSQRTLYTRLQP